MYINRSQVKDEAYQNHQVFKTLDKMMEYYDGLALTSFGFLAHGTTAIGNYSANIYLSIRSTLDGVRLLLKNGYVSDSFVLIRKLFDVVLVEIYLNVVREDQFDWMENFVVKDVDEWLNSKLRIPKTDKILNALKASKTTKELYPLFGWDSDLMKIREFLDDNVHSNSYYNILLNCPEIYLQDREEQLANAEVVLKQIMLIHVAFTFYMNGPYMMTSDYIDYIEMGEEPPEGSECWLAPYAQTAFDEFVKPHENLAAFVKEHCCMNIA